ncbi:MAG: hypothetical protein M3R41_08525 [Pseudomonadota bacterium]|nr:hypothetical protein [Pseudomonadota bacterium]
MLDSILRFDDPFGEPSEIADGQEVVDPAHIAIASVEHAETVTLKTEQPVLTATPSEHYLSKAAARALQRHLIEGWGLVDPRICLMTIPALRPSRSLVIGKSHAQFAAEGVTDELITLRARALSWYFPPSRSLMLMPDEWTVETMTPLAELT